MVYKHEENSERKHNVINPKQNNQRENKVKSSSLLRGKRHLFPRPLVKELARYVGM
jgi:hypothetical protein